ncbi:MAG: hypothetical protein NTW97_05670 [Candidatus Krumholzibacteria bacterium]|nr:hypothetical protein [Candidatus Krumholzibacteria bacterium]
MGFLDKMKESVKDATGIGLNAQQQYERAYQKGVLLQPPKYQDAIKEFHSATEKFLKDGNKAMADRATANACLYQLVVNPDRESLAKAIQALEGIPEIERIGSQKDMMATPPLITELNAIGEELSARDADDGADKIAKFRKAGDTFMKLGSSPFQFVDKFSTEGPLDKAMNRSIYCMALADYHEGLCLVMESPTRAHDFMQKASIEFRQSMTNDWAEKTGAYVERIKSKRHCWMCSREMQGKDIFYKYYPAKSEKYHHQLVQDLKQDHGMIDSPNSVTLCTICGSSIENQADHYAVMRAQEVKDWVEPILAEYQKVLQNHHERLKDLEAVAHRHTS